MSNGDFCRSFFMVVACSDAISIISGWGWKMGIPQKSRGISKKPMDETHGFDEVHWSSMDSMVQEIPRFPLRFSLDSIAISAWRLTVVWDVLLWFLEGRDFGHKFSKFHTVLWNIHSYSIDFITNYFMGRIWEFSANISMNQHVFFSWQWHYEYEYWMPL